MAPGTTPPLSTTVPVIVLLPAPCAQTPRAQTRISTLRTPITLDSRRPAFPLQVDVGISPPHFLGLGAAFDNRLSIGCATAAAAYMKYRLMRDEKLRDKTPS
jgi:hypothetical protein